jgi:hypothetical protein
MTRGERNNNPLNIDRTTISWEGMAADQSGDDRFIVFTDPKFCYRAASHIIRKHYATGSTSVLAIVNAWAPPVENDTSSYASDVAKRVGVDVHATLSITKVVGEPCDLLALLKAMTIHENGENTYPDAVIQAGMDLDASGN